MKIQNLPYRAYKRTMPGLCENRKLTNVKKKILDVSCSPVAVANIISYLAHTNRARLLPPQGNHSKAYIHTKLIETLIKNMNTDEHGTSNEDIISGLEKYVTDRGYKIKISCQGDTFPKSYVKSPVVDPEQIMYGALGPRNSILGTVEYKYRRKSDSYRGRYDTKHSITVAGFNSAYNELFIRDPVNPKKKNICCEVVNLKDKKIFNWNGRYNPNSQFYELREYDNEPTINIIEDALCFEVYPK